MILLSLLNLVTMTEKEKTDMEKDLCPDCGQSLYEDPFKERRDEAEKVYEDSSESNSDQVEILIKAIAMFRKLAEEGDVESCLRLGDIYEGIDRYDESLEFYEKAAEMGSPRGQYDYWGIVSEYCHYDKELLKKGFAYLLKAVESGYPYACFDLGNAYEEGIGVKPDIQEAIRWYEKDSEGAEGGFSAYHLGEIYWLGERVKKDKEKALYWFDVAVKKGYTDKEDIKAIIQADEESHLA